MTEIKYHAAVAVCDTGECLVVVRGQDEDSVAAGPVKTKLETLGEEIRKLSERQDELQKAAIEAAKAKRKKPEPAKTASAKKDQPAKAAAAKPAAKAAPSVAALNLF